MNRENVYFSHDANAMNDPKCMMLITQLGMEGYGIFWGLVELLRQQPNYRMSLSLVPSIAARFMVSSQKIETVIRSYDLFRIEDDQFFFSQSLRDRMSIMDQKTEMKRLAGKLGGIRSGESRRMKALQPYTGDRSSALDLLEANAKQNEAKKRKEKKGNIKEKESIEKEKESASPSPFQSRRFVAPSLQEVENYIIEKGYHVNAKRFIAFYESKGWMIGKNKMKSWKQALVTWETRERPQNTTAYEPESESIYDNCLQ